MFSRYKFNPLNAKCGPFNRVVQIRIVENYIRRLASEPTKLARVIVEIKHDTYSRVTGFKLLLAAASMILRPTMVLPVNAIYFRKITRNFIFWHVVYLQDIHV
jgi:hypothetical protein